MKLKDYASLTATLRLKSGLHIGTGERPERGEPLPVMESPRTKLPYIPGSSLKGKMRCLLELTYGRIETDPRDGGSPCWCGRCQICLLFGSGSSVKTYVWATIGREPKVTGMVPCKLRWQCRNPSGAILVKDGLLLRSLLGFTLLFFTSSFTFFFDTISLQR